MGQLFNTFSARWVPIRRVFGILTARPVAVQAKNKSVYKPI
jgi:hypothetical protein